MPRTCNKILCSYKTDERRSVQTSMNGFQAILSEKKMAKQRRHFSGVLLSHKKDSEKPH